MKQMNTETQIHSHRNMRTFMPCRKKCLLWVKIWKSSKSKKVFWEQKENFRLSKYSNLNVFENVVSFTPPTDGKAK